LGENDIAAFYQLNKTIDIILTPTYAFHIPYKIHVKATNQKPRGKIIIVSKPKIFLKNL